MVINIEPVSISSAVLTIVLLWMILKVKLRQ